MRTNAEQRGDANSGASISKFMPDNQPPYVNNKSDLKEFNEFGAIAEI